MNVEEYLNGAKGIKEIIAANMNELEALYSMRDSLPSSGSGSSGGCSNKDAPFVNVVERIEEQIELIRKENEEYEAIRRDIGIRIRKISNRYQRVILQEHYLNFQTIRVIAERIGYSERNTYELKKKALKSFAKLNPDIF